MKYEELYNDFKKLFPEDSDYFAEQEKKLGRNSLDLITVVFDSIVSPYLIKLADENPQKAKKAFAGTKYTLVVKVPKKMKKTYVKVFMGTGFTGLVK